ncbi:MAG: hypothetical protein ABH844_06075 [Candidatus Omnitrophota bacterium]
MVWIEFLICAGLLTFFAYNLCKEGIIISEKTHIEEGIIGMFFLAIATSFPEIITSASAVFSLGRIGLGYGDIIGSLIVNFMILFALDYFYGGGRILLKASKLNRMTVIFVLASVLTVLGGAVLRLLPLALPHVGRIGIESLFIVGQYLLYLKIVHKNSRTGEIGSSYKNDESLGKIWVKFISFLGIVMLLSVWMARVGEKIIVLTNLSQTFTGALLLGLATSLPEIIVSFAALRASSLDMAIGNIFGSNLFDLCIIPFLDVLTKAPILGMLTAGQIIATVIALILTVVVLVGLFSKKDTKTRFNWDTGLIFLIGFLGFVVLYFVK